MSGSGAYIKLSGISASPGIAIGRAFLHSKEVPPIRRRRIRLDQVEAEVERFLSTLHQAGEETRRTRRLVSGEHGEDLAQIFDAQLAMLGDVEMKELTLDCIRTRQWSAERAFKKTLAGIRRGFEAIQDEYLRQRLGDLIDIERQVLLRLVGGDREALNALRANAIVVAHDLLPSESVQLGGRRVKGIALDVGGATSHAAIIARSLGLPTVLGVQACTETVASGDMVIVDGNEGTVHVRPADAVLRQYRTRVRRQRRRERDLSSRRGLPAVTLDGQEIALLANIDGPAEVQAAIDNGACGVGMHRTEFLFLDYRLPTEEEQLAVYGQIVRAMAPHPVTIRTIDLGGDKLAQVLEAPAEANPYLGWRGIRICLDSSELFKTQLRAILRAGVHGDVRILLPMVASLDELRAVRGILGEVQDELRDAGLPFQENCPLGIMIEVPSVALLADHFAAEAAFFSLGTNDLIQYTLAVDRGNARVAPLYDPYHPAVLRLISMVADSGRIHDIPVSICGELAGDPLATVLLLGMGVERLSMSPGLIPEVKEVVRSVSLQHAREVAERCRRLKTGAEVRALLQETMSHQPPSAAATARAAVQGEGAR